MQIFRNLADVQLSGPSVLTIGTFDGLHLGHQNIIRQLKSAAEPLGAQTAVIAFHPRPKAVFAPGQFGLDDYLTTPQERIALFEQLGIDVLVLTPFSLQFAQITAREFMEDISARFNLAQLWVGHDFALGKNRQGNIARLRQLGREFNYTVAEIEQLQREGLPVSSTQIRTCVSNGNVRQAAGLLGRYFSLTSQVMHGAQRGRTIGFPTANLAVPEGRLLPANGVYATFVSFANRPGRYASVTNVGVRPSFNETERTVESYIFDFAADIYGETVTLEFVEHLRPEMKFTGIEALIAQIARDAEQARILLAKET